MAGALQEHQQVHRADPGDGSSGPLALVALLAGGAALGWLLWQIDGPPHIASIAPDWAHMREVLMGSDLADSDVIAASTTVAWLVLAYLGLTVGLRLVIAGALRISGGARWARAAMTLSNLVTIPAVRRVVDGGVAGTLLLASWTQAPARTALAVEPAAIVTIAPRPAPDLAVLPAIPPPDAPDPQGQPSERFVEYTVARGDYLWDIARRLYGDGSRFVEIFETNRGRVMAGGEVFDDPRLIRTGWVLRVPLPALNLTVEEGVATYDVRRGDHLWGIAERFLGDGFRWIEIWELNRGRELEDGWRFTDPNLISSGWRLELPLEVGESAESPVLPSSPPTPTVTPTAAAPSTPSAVSPDVSDDLETANEELEAPRGGSDWEWPSLPKPVVVTAAGFAVIGGVALFVRRLARHGQLRVLGAQQGSDLGSGDAGRVTLATRALARALADFGFNESRPLMVREFPRGRLEFTVQCPVGDGDALVEHRHDLERRLACNVEAEVVGSTRLLITLSGFRRIAAQLGDESDAAPPSLVVPVGGDDEGIVYLDLAAVGGVSVIGSESERRQLLRSWFATLATTHPPQELALRIDAEASSLLGDAVALPHTGGAQPADADELAEELEALLVSRGSASTERPVLAVVEPGAQHEAIVDELLRDGRAAGLFLVASMAVDDPSVRRAWPASVAFSHGEEDIDDEGGGAPDGLALTVGRDRPLILDPVVVRRDTSDRWAANAEGEDEAVPFVEQDEALDTGTDLAGVGAEPLPQGPKSVDEAGEAPGTGEGAEVVQAIGGSEWPEGPEDEELPDAAPSREDEEAPAEPQLHVAEVGDIRSAPEPSDGEGPNTADAGVPPTPARQGALFATSELLPGSADAGASSPVFVVRCLGGFQVLAQGTAIERWSLEKSRELLAFLIAHGGVSVAREAAAEALWPGIPWDGSLKHSLSNATTTLRKTLRSAASNEEIQPLQAARGRLQLPAALFEVDLDGFDAALRGAAGLADGEALDEYERALALYAGDFLEGEFFDWADSYRLEYRQRFLSAARRAAALAEAIGDVERSVRFYRAVLDCEPTDEGAARGMMRSLAESGDALGARKVMKALSEALRRELDDPSAAPSAETRALFSELAEAVADG